MNDFVRAISSKSNKNIKGVQAVYKRKSDGEIMVTAVYSLPVLKMVMDEIDTAKYQFIKIINEGVCNRIGYLK